MLALLLFPDCSQPHSLSDYTFVHPDRPGVESHVPGRSLSKAWLYDGYSWNPLKPMTEIRARRKKTANRCIRARKKIDQMFKPVWWCMVLV